MPTDIRDKIAASKKKGMWMGGQPALGYDVKERKVYTRKSSEDGLEQEFNPIARLGCGIPASADRRGVLDAAVVP